jgi:transcriptional regulator with XRE-family HTH domain
MESKLPTAIDEHVSERVRARREELKISQPALAEELGISFQQLQKYENGRNRISAGRLFDLAVALKTTIPYFFHGFHGGQRAARGVAEDSENGFDAGYDAEAAELMKAYRSIDDLSERKAVLSLAKELARSSKRQVTKKPKKTGR